ncbi:MAG TPA: hypothetical protein VE954_32655, partial [Oligoflexus sp.]|uniref:hypothetical protein n=1 Tax=Oligoflexus sp. TaxID=1971216 RepID=UPI002D5BBE2A
QLILDRDVNAALVILNYALTGFVTGREPASGVEEKNSFPVKHETPFQTKSRESMSGCQARRACEDWVEQFIQLVEYLLDLPPDQHSLTKDN